MRHDTIAELYQGSNGQRPFESQASQPVAENSTVHRSPSIRSPQILDYETDGILSSQSFKEIDGR